MPAGADRYGHKQSISYNRSVEILGVSGHIITVEIHMDFCMQVETSYKKRHTKGYDESKDQNRELLVY